MNVVCTGDRRLRRGAGHRGGRAVRPGHARRAARPRAWPAARQLTEAAAGGAGAHEAAVLATRNAEEAGRAAADPGAAGGRRGRRARRRAGVRGGAGDRRHLRGERAAQGAGGGPAHRPAGGRRRLRAGRGRAERDARRAVGPVVRARHGDDEANLRLVLAQIADVPDERRGAAFVCAAALVTPDGTEQVVERPAGRRAAPRAARDRTASATTRSSQPDGETRTTAELTRPRRTRSATAAGPSAPSPRSSPTPSAASQPRRTAAAGAAPASALREQAEPRLPCGRGDSNPHARGHQDLNLTRLPVTPLPLGASLEQRQTESFLRREATWPVALTL